MSSENRSPDPIEARRPDSRPGVFRKQLSRRGTCGPVLRASSRVPRSLSKRTAPSCHAVSFSQAKDPCPASRGRPPALRTDVALLIDFSHSTHLRPAPLRRPAFFGVRPKLATAPDCIVFGKLQKRGTEFNRTDARARGTSVPFRLLSIDSDTYASATSRECLASFED